MNINFEGGQPTPEPQASVGGVPRHTNKDIGAMMHQAREQAAPPAEPMRLKHRDMAREKAQQAYNDFLTNGGELQTHTVKISRGAKRVKTYEVAVSYPDPYEAFDVATELSRMLDGFCH